MKHTRIVTGVTATALAALLAGAPGAFAAPSTQAASSAATAAPAALPAATTLPVTGTVTNAGQAVPFVGALSNLTVKTVGGVPTLTGTLTGTNLPAAGTPFSTPLNLAQVQADCQILNLDLGPLHLNVLGLVVDLNAVHLDITAVPGAGNLLGNLLCAVANLLNNGGPLQGIAALLNQILTGLGL